MPYFNGQPLHRFKPFWSIFKVCCEIFHLIRKLANRKLYLVSGQHFIWLRKGTSFFVIKDVSCRANGGIKLILIQNYPPPPPPHHHHHHHHRHLVHIYLMFRYPTSSSAEKILFEWGLVIVFVEGRDLTIFRWYFVIILLVGRPGSSSYHCHFFFHILPCLELANGILHSVMMCILVLYTFLEDTTFKDIGGFVIFLFFFYQMIALK